MDDKGTHTTSAPVPDWFDLLQRQAMLYERLGECAARQRGMIESDRVDSLMSLLFERQKLTTELTGLSKELAPVQSRWGSFCADLGEAERLRRSVKNSANVPFRSGRRNTGGTSGSGESNSPGSKRLRCVLAR